MLNHVTINPLYRKAFRSKVHPEQPLSRSSQDRKADPFMLALPHDQLPVHLANGNG